MSGVYIRGMEMPHDCEECRFSCWGMCVANNKRLISWQKRKRKRAFFCPLIPVPDHGDLIDRDALIRSCHFLYKFRTYQGNWVYDEKALRYAKTVITADKDGAG